MKKPLSFVFSLALIFALILSLAGCGNKGEDSSSSSPPPAPLASSSQNDASSESEPASAAISDASSQPGGPAPAPIALEGSFYNSDPERYPDDRAPYLVLEPGGTFEFHINTGEGKLGLITGTYEALGTQVTLTALSCDCEDFLGEELTSFPFTRQDDVLLVYNGEPIGLTRSGNEFLLEGATRPVPVASSSSEADNSSSPLPTSSASQEA